MIIKKMNCLLILQLILAVKSVLAMKLHILTDDSKILTRSGQTLTLPCVAKGKKFDFFSNPLIWYKVANNGEEFQINTGAVISLPYSDTGRYGVDPHVDFGVISTVEMPLSIKGLTLAENGTYRCELRDKSKVLASIIHQVDIIGPITKLELTSPEHHYNNKSRQEVFVFGAREPGTVTCNFVGSGPPPVMHIIRGEVDITPLFVRSESVRVIGEPGLQYTMYNIEYRTTKLKMGKEHIGETLYCTAQVPTFTELSLTKTAAIDVLYAAQFSCDTELLATVGEVDLEIACRISANPPVEVGNVWWTSSGGDWKLGNGQSRGDFSCRIAVTEGVTLATLTIANVSNSSFQTYYLTAQTMLAKRQHAIVLEEEVPTTFPPSTTTTTPTTTTRKPRTVKTTPTTLRTTVTPSSPPTTTKFFSPVVSERTKDSLETVPMSTTTTTTTSKVITPTPTPVSEKTTVDLVPSTATPKVLSVVQTTSRVSTTTHKRRKHGKHKHKKNKKNKGQSGSNKSRSTTLSTFISTTPVSKLEKVQVENNQEEATSPKNRTSENKTVDKQDTPDVQYTIIDEPVKENNSNSGACLRFISFLGFILPITFVVITL